MKPKYIIIYKNDEKLNQLLDCFPFNVENEILKKQRGKDEHFIEYNHFVLKAYKINRIHKNTLRGQKAWGLFVEDCLYREAVDNDLLMIFDFIVYIFPTKFITRF